MQSDDSMERIGELETGEMDNDVGNSIREQAQKYYDSRGPAAAQQQEKMMAPQRRLRELAAQRPKTKTLSPTQPAKGQKPSTRTKFYRPANQRAPASNAYSTQDSGKATQGRSFKTTNRSIKSNQPASGLNNSKFAGTELSASPVSINRSNQASPKAEVVVNG